MDKRSCAHPVQVAANSRTPDIERSRALCIFGARTAVENPPGAIRAINPGPKGQILVQISSSIGQGGLQLTFYETDIFGIYSKVKTTRDWGGVQSIGAGRANLRQWGRKLSGPCCFSPRLPQTPHLVTGYPPTSQLHKHPEHPTMAALSLRLPVLPEVAPSQTIQAILLPNCH